MYSFGKLPPRDLEAFGVASLLDKKCRVFYENLFSTQHLGRISDLISARLRKSAPDELRLRALMLFATFEAYRAQQAGAIEGSDQPLLLEFGIDAEKVAIGISFNLPEGHKVNLEGMANRVQGRVPVDGFETMLGNLLVHAERLVLRMNPENRRCEVVSLLGLPGKIDEESLQSKHAIEVVKILKQKEEMPSAEEYTELGDTNYPDLLAEVRKATTGGEEVDEEGNVVVKGEAEVDEEGNVIVKSGAEAADDEETVVSGESVEELDQQIQEVDDGSEETKELVESLKARRAQAKAVARKKVIAKGGVVEDEEETTVKGAEAKPGEEKIVVKGKKVAARDEQGETVEGEEGAEDKERVVIKGTPQKTQLEKIVVKGKKEEKEPETVRRFTADKPEEESRTVIKGTTQNVKNDKVTRIAAGAPEAPQPEAVVKVLGGPSEQVIRDYENKIRDLEYRLSKLAATKAETTVVGGTEGAAPIKAGEETLEEGEKKEGVLGKIWPFKKKKDEKHEDEAETAEGAKPKPKKEKEEDSVLDEIEALREERLEKAAEDEKDKEKKEGEEPEAPSASALVDEIQAGGLDKTLMRAREEFSAIKKELGSAKAQNWAESLLGDMTTEKSRLNELAKKLSITVRQKEFEFRNKENSMQEELKRRDEMIRQKNVALVRTKDQLAQLTMNYERVKSAKGGAADEASYRTKYNTSQKILLQAKEENTQLTKKVEELRNLQAQSQASTKTKGPTYEEYTEMQGKVERTTRQVEELKKSNQQLLERLEEAKKSRTAGAGGVDDLKKRLEASMRLAADKKREADKLRPRVDELNRETVKLKMEVGRLQTENKTLRSAAARASGGKAPAGAPAAAAPAATETKPGSKPGTGGTGTPSAA